MIDQSIIIVTPPDDITLDAIRILGVNLDHNHTNILSDGLKELDFSDPILIYLWKQGDNFDWLVDKKIKSDIIIFNADINDSLTGYLAGQKKSFYFGNLKYLHKFNNRCLYNKYDFMQIINKVNL